MHHPCSLHRKTVKLDEISVDFLYINRVGQGGKRQRIGRCYNLVQALLVTLATVNGQTLRNIKLVKQMQAYDVIQVQMTQEKVYRFTCTEITICLI